VMERRRQTRRAKLLGSLVTFALRRTTAAGAILCYHGIRQSQSPTASTLHLFLEEIVATLDALRDVWTLAPLSEIVRRERSGRSARGLLAVTFDDACVTVLQAAADFLGRESIPATVFPVANAARLGARFWWDRLDDLFPHVSGERWRRFEEACGLPEAYRRGQAASFGPLRPLRQWILARFQGRWPPSLEPVLEELETDVGHLTPQRSMTFEEIWQLARRAPVEVGVHTLTHPVLPLLPDEEMHREISGSFEVTATSCPNPVPILAIPFGLFDARAVTLARDAGMVSSLSLGGTGLEGTRPAACLPRMCMSTGIPAWKVMLRLSGFLDRRWPGRALSAPEYPDLPSATT